MWYCNGCGEERHGTQCKKWCYEKYGDMGAERIPRLDGMAFFNDDGSGIPRWEYRKQETDRYYIPKMVSGSRPQGWNTAMDVMGARAAALIVGGLPEC